jgi:hypothetical protein
MQALLRRSVGQRLFGSMPWRPARSVLLAAVANADLYVTDQLHLAETKQVQKGEVEKYPSLTENA